MIPKRKNLQHLYITFILLQELMQTVFATPFVQVHSSDLQIQVFSATQANSYKSLALIDNVLYIGARGKLFRQNAANITKTSYPSSSWTAVQADKDRCNVLPQGSNGVNCYNYIRTIQRYNATHILLCGSNALRAQNAFLDVEDGSIHEAPSLTTPFCSYNPSDLGISIVGETSATAATVAAVTRHQLPDQSNLVKNLPDSNFLFATQGKGKMIETNAQFVSSFHHQDTDSGHSMNKLYFVFGEAVQEPAPYKREFGSRIAQVCADDLGGKWNDGGNRWTSFLKAPLLCQSNEENPFMFGKVTHSTFSDDGFLYATFTTQSASFRISAVCAFDINNIQKNFHAKKFWGLSHSDNYHKSSSQFKNPSPGDCAYSGMEGIENPTSKDFTSDFLSFMGNYPLVASAVLPVHPLKPNAGQSGPLLSITEEYFTQIAVQRVEDANGKHHTVIFVGFNSGKILKFISILKDNEPENRLLSQYDIGDEEITGLLVYDSLNILYVEAKSKVVQLSTGNCEVYSKPCDFCDPCRMCILARDPMCAWSKEDKKCVDIRTLNGNPTLYQDVTSGNVSMCGSLQPMHQYIDVAPIGRYVILGMGIKTGSSISVSWFNETTENRQQLATNPATGHYRINSDQLLEIKNFSRYDVATYIAEYRMEDSLVAIKSTSYTDKAPVLSTTSTITSTVTPSTSTADDNNVIQNYTWIEPTTASITPANNASLPMYSIVIIAIAGPISVVIALVVVLFFFRKRRLIKGKHSVSEDLYDEHRDMTDSVRNKKETKKPGREDFADCAVSSERVPLVDLKPRAAVSPMVINSDSIESDGATTESKSNRPKTRKPPERSKSFQSKAIRVNIDNNVYKCHSIKRDKKTGDWLMAVRFPQDITFEDLSGDEDSDSEDEKNPPERKSKTLPVFDSNRIPSEIFGSGDAYATFSPSKGARALHEDNTASNLYDTDSDSTIKAPISSLSSTASTPRSEGAKNSKASLTLPQPTKRPRQNPYENLPIPHIDSTSEEAMPPPQRRGSTNSGKSPSSDGSSLSQSSTDQYKTPPASPFKKIYSVGYN